jgi:catechol 2,3-dioxygenase-like lactoylglutathione lyase family enzyme
MVLLSIRLGTNDAEQARSFYDATFAALGLADLQVPMDVPTALYRLPGGIHFMLGPPRDGEAASCGNGDTLGFAAPDAASVDRWHAAGLAHGGRSEGEPGPRAAAGGRYGAYLRDPDGHKLCAYAPA